MAHSRTAKQNIRQNERCRIRNKAQASAMRTQLKKVREAIEGADAAAAQDGLSYAQKLIDKAAKTNQIHQNKAARLKSKLAKAIHRAAQA